MSIGHNKGPALDGGTSWRKHCWTAARSALLPTLPIEVVRLRVRRAKELGLDYTTYASVRAATGHDVVAFLFSSNALRVSVLRPAVPEGRLAKLTALVDAGRFALVTAPMTPGMVLAGTGALDAAFAAPGWLDAFGDQGRAIRAALPGIAGDRVILVGDHGLERDWCAAGRLAGYLAAERYFGEN